MNNTNTNTWTVKVSVMKGRVDVTEEKRHGQMVKGHHCQYSWGFMIFFYTSLQCCTGEYELNVWHLVFRNVKRVSADNGYC